MKEFIKDILANIVYLLYKWRILRNHIRVASIDETLDELIHTDKSIVRYGDGEIVLLCGRSIPLQKPTPELSERLKQILHYDNDNLIVTLPGIFDDLSSYCSRSKRFWKKHLLSFRKVYEKNCNPERKYYNTSVSRMYYNFKDKSNCGKWLLKFKEVWNGKDIVFVEGSATHNGVGNDLFNNAGNIERIICPPSNAFYTYGRILEACKRLSKDKLILVSLGATAKPLTADLFAMGYRVIDIGNLDMEYEWFLRKADDKPQIEKHRIIGKEANIKAGYTEYMQQIIAYVENTEEEGKKSED